MSKPPPLLVVTPTLGSSPYLENCVEVVKALHLDTIHILSCPEPMVSGLQGRFKSCRVIRDAGRDGGMYGAINAALKDRAGIYDWFTYINDDDELTPGFAEMFRTFATPENEAKVGYGDTRHIDAEGKSLGLIPTERNQSHFLPLIKSRIYPLTQQGMLVGPKVMKAVGLYDANYRHVADLDFSVRCIRGGFDFCYHPYEVARFRLHGAQISGNRDEVNAEYVILHDRLKEVRISPARRLVSKLKFRLRNVPRYIERLRTVGWMSAEAMTGKPLSSRAGSH